MANEKKKILLVYDDDIHLTTAELFLRDEYDIYKAISGEDALKCLNNNEFIPNLIMLDILMPDMNGWEVYSKVRAINSFKNVPIVFLTSVQGEAEKKKAREIGAADYIVKPFNLTDLKKRITEALQKKTK